MSPGTRSARPPTTPPPSGLSDARRRAEVAPASKEFLQDLRGKLRVAMAKANEGDRRWKERHAWLTAYVAENASNFASEGSKRAKFAEDWKLNDADAYWRHWQGEVLRFAAAISAEVAMAGLIDLSGRRI